MEIFSFVLRLCFDYPFVRAREMEFVRFLLCALLTVWCSASCTTYWWLIINLYDVMERVTDMRYPIISHWRRHRHRHHPLNIEFFMQDISLILFAQ